MKRMLLILWGSFLFSNLSFAENSSLTLSQALELVRSRAPDVILSHQDTTISEAERLKANRYPNPDISFSIGPNYETLELSGTQKKVYAAGTVSQEIELWGKRRLRKEISEEQITFSEIQSLITTQNVEERIKVLYAAIQRGKERFALTQENIKIAERFVGTAQLKFQQNQAPYADVLRARMELVKQHKVLVQEKNDLKILKQQMNLQLGRDLDTPFYTSDSFQAQSKIPPLTALLPRSIEKPEFQAIEVQKRQQGKELALAKQEAKPNPKIGFFIEKDAPDFHYGPSISMSIPTWYRNKGEIETAKARQLKTEYQKTYLEKKTELTIRENYLELQKAIESLDLQKEMIQNTGELFRTTFQAYLEGKADFLRFLETLQSVNNFKSEYYDTLFDYFVKRAALERALGASLSK